MRHLITILITFLTFCPGSVTPVTAQQHTTQTLTGEWQGEGRIIVTWSQQKTLSFDLSIDEKGSVTGQIGDAVVRDARLTRRSWLMRKLGNGEYLIRGRLDGELIAAEKIRRDSFWLMLSQSDNRLTGGLNSSGWKWGGREKMILTVTEIILHRRADRKGKISCTTLLTQCYRS